MRIRFINKQECAEAAVKVFRANKWTWWCWDEYTSFDGRFIPFRENIEKTLDELEKTVLEGHVYCATGRLEVGVDDKGMYYCISPSGRSLYDYALDN